MRPLLVLVTGPAAAGKTTLAHVLGRELALPVVSKDEIKSGLVRTSGGSGFEIGHPVGQRAWALFVSTLELFLSEGVSVIGEQAFEVARATETLAPLLEMADVRIVHACPPDEVCEARFRRRAVEAAERRVAHPDAEVIALFDRGDFDWRIWDPPRVDAPVLRVDTSDGYDPDLEAIVAFLVGA